jgi:hypothetical protein
LQWELRDIFCSLTQQKVIFHWLIILDNILKNFTNTNDYLMILAKVAIVLVIILSFPMIHFCCRDSIEGFFFKIKFQDIFFNGWEFSWFRWVLEAFILCSISYVLAVFIPSITIVFGLTGATTGSLVVFGMI